MLTIPKSIILGIIQGITEWLPISSSGHLVLIQKLLNLNAPLFFDIWLHMATLVVIIIFCLSYLVCTSVHLFICYF